MRLAVRGLASGRWFRYAVARGVHNEHRSQRDPTRAAAGVHALGAAHWLALLAATAVAAWLRLANLGTWSLWIDEAHTWRDATMPWEGLDAERKLYSFPFLLLRGLLSRGLIEGDAYSLRLPFATAGILTIPLVAMCGRRLVGAWAAVLAAWLCAVNPWHVYWSQNARGYVLVFLFAVVAANRAQAYVETLLARHVFTMMTAIGLATLCHPGGGLLVAGFVVFLVARRFRTLDGRTLVLLLLVASLALVALPLVSQWLPFQGFLRSKRDASLLHVVQTIAYYFGPLVLLAAAGGIALGWRALGRDRAVLLAAFWLVPFLVLVAVGSSVAKVTARYAICALPMILWLAGFACARCAAAPASGPWRKPGRLVAASILSALLFGQLGGSSLAYHTERHGDRARWEEACAWAKERAGSGALRVLTVSQPTVLYYLRPLHWSSGTENPYPGVVVVPLIDWMVVGGVDEDKRRVCEPGAENNLRWHVEQAKKAGAKFVVMVTLPELAEQDVEPRNAIRDVLRSEFDLALHLPCWVGPKDESIHVFVPRDG